MPSIQIRYVSLKGLHKLVVTHEKMIIETTIDELSIPFDSWHQFIAREPLCYEYVAQSVFCSMIFKTMILLIRINVIFARRGEFWIN